uniref:CYTH domain-containing protein n=1 Tax=Toxocara canis TaxID=6265 RepID=A0A183U4P3_TOXCA
LIFYDRPDCDGPKLSDFHKVRIEDHKNLKKILALSMGILGEVKKRRILFIYEQTRIHIDEVEGLGSFMELEVCLRDEQTPEDGQSIAEQIMRKLDIKSSQLVSGAYMDALLSAKALPVPQ